MTLNKMIKNINHWKWSNLCFIGARYTRLRI